MAMLAALLLDASSIIEEFQKLAADKDPDLRCRAVDLAAKSREPRLFDGLTALLGDPHPRVRLRAVDTLATAKARDASRTALRHSNPLVRQGACEVLGRIGTADDVLERLGDRDPHVRGAAAEALGRLGDKAAVDPLLAALKRESEWPLRAYGLEALVRMDRAGAEAALAAAEDDRHWEARVVAAELRPTAHLVNDRDWRVRAAAVAGCRTVRSRDCLGWLIEQLGREEGRLRWDVVQALHDLADRDLGLSPDPWRAWWAVNRETFTPKPAGKPGSGPPSAVSTQASFFSVPILSTRMVFLLDLSGSMREPAPGGGTKLDEAKRGMLATIRMLPPKARFGITGLGCDAGGAWAKLEEKTWGRRLTLIPGSPAAKADAERFVQKLEARGWTNLWDGLEHAMSAPDVDTVFLYSDGGASKGTFSAAGEILSRLERLNRFRRVVVHAVEVPGERNPADNRRLLQAIARTTGGDARLFDRK